MVGSANARILLDTPKSQLVDLDQSNPVGLDGTVADGLPIRVGVLADELESDSWRAALASAAGIPAGQIDIASSNTGATYTTPLARRLLELNAVADRPYVVRITTNGSSPIVNVFATAPTGAEAKRLADGTVATYKSLIAVNGAMKGFVVRPLGPTRAAQFVHSSGKAMTAAVAVLALGAWLVGIVFAGGLASAWVRSRPNRVVSA